MGNGLSARSSAPKSSIHNFKRGEPLGVRSILAHLQEALRSKAREGFGDLGIEGL